MRKNTVGVLIGVILLILSTCAFATDEGNKDKDIYQELDELPIDFIFYSDFSFKNTNFLKRDYNAVSGWSELRLVLDTYSLIFKCNPADRYATDSPYCDSLPLGQKFVKLFVPNPYFKTTFAASSAAGFTDFTEAQVPFHNSGRIARENSFVYGFGAENRFLARADELFLDGKLYKNPYLHWLRAFRLFGENLDLEWWAGDWWQAEHDLRIGIDYWYEWNVPGGEGWPYEKEKALESHLKLWGELWMEGSWRKTNFFSTDYNSWTFGTAEKLGIRAWNWRASPESKISVHLMPYVTMEASVSEKNDFFWENRLLAGGGIRLMPRIKLCSTKDLLIRLFAEHVTAVDYFKSGPDSEVPWNDIRVGINFSINRH
ncbi:MAG: hypothetical protein ACUZ77_05110 [Candidatus Brocadiales bacterium]